MKKVLEEVAQERARQNEKWGVQDHNAVEWVAILTEEVGEVAKEAVDFYFSNKVNGGFIGMVKPDKATQKARIKNYRKECIQVAAVAVQMVESLDRQLNKTK